MNKEKLLELATIVENTKHIDLSENVPAGERQFNMAIWLYGPTTGNNGCGTVACIGGTAQVCFLKDQKDVTSHDVREVLGLDEYTADDLFYPNSLNVYYEKITPAQAAWCIRNLVETGEVDWDAATRE